MDATSKALDVTGNNLANLNTTGFKQSSVSFFDMMTQTMGASGHTQVGMGVNTPYTIRNFTQGGTQSTSNSLDAAIQGDGFFVLQGANNSQLLTRSGSFHQDASGTLMTLTGEKVQGWTQLNADGTVNTSGVASNIQIPTGNVRNPVATKNFTLDMNLDATATVGDSTGSYTTPITVVDSLGNSQTLTMTFTKTDANKWTYDVTLPDSALSSPSSTPLATGTLEFDSHGVLTSPAASSDSTDNSVAIKITGLADGAADMDINWNLNNANGTPRLQQVSQASNVSGSSQDGTAATQLTSIAIGDGGAIYAKYSNGEQQIVGQLAMASVRNPDSLLDVGNNNFATTINSATPVVGQPQTGGRGNIMGNSLESSTVDVAKEFTNLIIYQRSYQANAKVINTEDQLSQDTLSIKQ